MPPPRWTTEEQTKFLFSHIGKFTEHQNNDSLYAFWPFIEKEWNVRWPTDNLNHTPNEKDHSVSDADQVDEGSKGAEIAQLKKRIRAWYNNNSETRKKTPLRAKNTSFSAVATRVKQPAEIWASKFYKQKVKDKVQAECEAIGIAPNRALGVIKRHIKEAFDTEPEDVRQEIFAESQALKEAAKLKRLNAIAPTPESYAEAISYVSDVSYRFINMQHEQTGWTWTLLGGGPDPNHGGRLRTVVYHAGRNHLDHNFGAAHVSFRESVLNPFAAFVKSSFTIHVNGTSFVFPDSVFSNKSPSLLSSNPPSPVRPASKPRIKKVVTMPVTNTTGRGKRVRKAASTKEVTPLTVDTNGKRTFDANRKPVASTITGKRKQGKESPSTAKRPKK
ncbi:hypothetical protein C0992_011550 [Termitomyces sp. T32_za158]|nr:hypothetical protein C0992_011550 [Termitomyces sp. T32_za158]